MKIAQNSLFSWQNRILGDTGFFNQWSESISVSRTVSRPYMHEKTYMYVVVGVLARADGSLDDN